MFRFDTTIHTIMYKKWDSVKFRKYYTGKRHIIRFIIILLYIIIYSYIVYIIYKILYSISDCTYYKYAHKTT